ncbi:MAG: hypothetical protein HQL54_09225 [Magnetococcales bacterium]|nr:hypothetical protein [Magnetococcales bacterium]
MSRLTLKRSLMTTLAAATLIAVSTGQASDMAQSSPTWQDQGFNVAPGEPWYDQNFGGVQSASPDRYGTPQPPPPIQRHVAPNPGFVPPGMPTAPGESADTPENPPLAAIPMEPTPFGYPPAPPPGFQDAPSHAMGNPYPHAMRLPGTNHGMTQQTNQWDIPNQVQYGQTGQNGVIPGNQIDWSQSPLPGQNGMPDRMRSTPGYHGTPTQSYGLSNRTAPSHGMTYGNSDNFYRPRPNQQMDYGQYGRMPDRMNRNHALPGTTPYGRLPDPATRYDAPEPMNYGQPGRSGMHYGQPDMSNHDMGLSHSGHNSATMDYGRYNANPNANYGMPSNSYQRPGNQGMYGRQAANPGMNYGRPDNNHHMNFDMPSTPPDMSYTMPDPNQAMNYGMPLPNRGMHFDVPNPNRGMNFDVPDPSRNMRFDVPSPNQAMNYAPHFDHPAGLLPNLGTNGGPAPYMSQGNSGHQSGFQQPSQGDSDFSHSGSRPLIMTPPPFGHAPDSGAEMITPPPIFVTPSMPDMPEQASEADSNSGELETQAVSE